MTSQRVSGTAVQRTIAVLGSAVFFVVAPCTLAGLVPWSITGWQLRPPFLGLELTRGIGAIMILAGVPGLVDAFARFALQGLGTPAPIAPTRNLVVTGLYRYVRNPIYVAVVAIILGQAVLMGDWRLIVYGALLWLAFHVFVVAYEEPTLEQTFGREYEAFRAAVPRWIPRMTPGGRNDRWLVAAGTRSRAGSSVKDFRRIATRYEKLARNYFLSPVPRCRRGILALIN